MSWYLATAAFCYFIFPFIISKLEKVKKRTSVLAALIVVYLLQIVLCFAFSKLPSFPASGEFFLSDVSDWIIYYFPLMRSLDFIMGCCAGYLYVTRSQDLTANKCSCFETVVVLTIVLSNVVCVFFENTMTISVGQLSGAILWWTLSIPFTLSSCAVIFLLLQGNSKLKKLITNRVTLFLGNISDSGFLIHYVVYRYIEAIMCQFISREIYETYGGYVKLLLGMMLTVLATITWKKIACFANGFKGKRS